MDEPEGQRWKVSTEDLADPINQEDSHYAQLQEALQSDAQNLEAESWSLSVDQNYLIPLNKEAIKRQDVIYELIQTEMHHVRTLKILRHVYMYELKQSLLVEEAFLDQLFPGVEVLLGLHQHFFNSLKKRQHQSQEEGSTNNYYIRQLGDILIYQFSGSLGEQMTSSYGHFCSHHTEALNLYKEQIQSDKKMQILVKKIYQVPLVRRLGISECFLLVTQRITKYPVLVERIIQNTEVDTDEYKALVKGLELIKDTISEVNALVSEYEKTARLREILNRLDPKSQVRLKNGQMFGRDELRQGRSLLLESTVIFKSSNRQKEVLAVLLSDHLLFLQEKDQKYAFASMDNKSPVISLKAVLVREVAMDEKAMYLICACISGSPEMYEIWMSSAEECQTWMNHIRDAANCCLENEAYCKLISKLMEFQDKLQEKDEQIKQSLTEKQSVIAELYKSVMAKETPHDGLLLRGDASDLQQGEALLDGAIKAAEYLQNLLVMRRRDPKVLLEEAEIHKAVVRRSKTTATANNNHHADGMKYGSEGGSPFSSECHERTPHDERETCPTRQHGSASSNFPKLLETAVMLTQRLYSLQAVIAEQDSRIEMQKAFHTKSKQPGRNYSNLLFEQEKQRSLEKQKEEQVKLQKQQAQHREEQQRWEKEKERERLHMQGLEAELQQREEACKQNEEKLNEEKAVLQRQWDQYQQDLERLRESTMRVDREQDRLEREKERLEKLKSKLPQYDFIPGGKDYPNSILSTSPSFREDRANGAETLAVRHPNTKDVPPRVPPRRESMSPHKGKQKIPMHLISTTSHVGKSSTLKQAIPRHFNSELKQAIPRNLTAEPKKEKSFRMKSRHKRAHSAANLDLTDLAPIRVTGKETSSLKTQVNHTRRALRSDTFADPRSAQNVKPSQLYSGSRQSSNDSPPSPPPFPKDLPRNDKEGNRKSNLTGSQSQEKKRPVQQPGQTDL